MLTTLKFKCPVCGQKHGVPPEYAGRVVRCGTCKCSVHVVIRDIPTGNTEHALTETDVLGLLDGDDEPEW
ncbi:MAG: hypothetical protein GC159_04815 [Phycisphaera sp.]|nr:hypothetical protein [Phycisphaera sp.]